MTSLNTPRLPALALAAVVKLAMLLGVNSLAGAGHDHTPQLAQAGAAQGTAHS